MRHLPENRRRTLVTRLILSVALPFIAGSVNVAGFLASGSFTSHVTGHFSNIGKEVVTGDYEAWATSLAVVSLFFLGSVTSTTLVHLARGRTLARHTLPLIIEGAALLPIAMLDHPAQTMGEMAYVACSLSYVMGIQNALVTRVFGAVLRTTHLTGILTDLGIEVTRLGIWVHAQRTRGRFRTAIFWRALFREDEWEQTRTHAFVLFSYVLGAMSGGVLYVEIGQKSMAFYSVWLWALAFYDAKYAIKRLDL